MPTGKLSPCSTHAAVNGSTLRRSDRRGLTETEWKRGFEAGSQKPHLRVDRRRAAAATSGRPRGGWRRMWVTLGLAKPPSLHHKSWRLMIPVCSGQGSSVPGSRTPVNSTSSQPQTSHSLPGPSHNHLWKMILQRFQTARCCWNRTSDRKNVTDDKVSFICLWCV